MDSDVKVRARERKPVALSIKFHQVGMGKSLLLYFTAIIKEEIFMGGKFLCWNRCNFIAQSLF